MLIVVGMHFYLGRAGNGWGVQGKLGPVGGFGGENSNDWCSGQWGQWNIGAMKLTIVHS